jgi:hypothetical protein
MLNTLQKILGNPTLKRVEHVRLAPSPDVLRLPVSSVPSMPARFYLRSCRRGTARDGHPALCANEDGSAQANRFGPAREWESVELILLDQPLIDDATVRVAIKGWHGKFLSASPDGHVHFGAAECREWEHFTLAEAGDGAVSIKSVHGKFLCADGGRWLNMGFGRDAVGGHIEANRDRVDQWESWHVTQDAHAFTQPGLTASLAISGALGIIGLLIFAFCLAVPALGFTAGGVAAGSAAAAAQSAVYGGTTFGLFSALQSMGATLTWVPVAAVAAVVASVSAVVAATAAAHGGSSSGDHAVSPAQLRELLMRCCAKAKKS